MFLEVCEQSTVRIYDIGPLNYAYERNAPEEVLLPF